MQPGSLKTRERLDVVSLGVEAGEAASIADAYATIVRRIESALDCACYIRAHDGAEWHTVAHAGEARQLSLLGPPISIPLAHGTLAVELVVRDTSGSSGTGACPDDAPAHDAGWRRTLGSALTAALQLVELRARQAESERCANLVRTFSQSLLVLADSAALHQLIVDGLARAVNAEIVSLAVCHPNEQVLSIAATHGYPAVLVEHLRIAAGDGVIGRVYATGEPIAVSGAGTGGRSGRRRYWTDSYVALPLQGPDGIVGVVCLTDKRDGPVFSDADVALLTSLSFAAALAVSREVLRTRSQDLAHLATVDPLTGLFNRRYFETRLEQEIQRQRRGSEELSLLMIDLDNFKELNDTQGHLVGDMALKEVAEILRRAIRIFDVCARFGGEEFVILMPGAASTTALRIAERIRRQVEQHFASGVRSGVPVPLTVSIGVSTATPTVTRDALIAEADLAMFRAKVTGKNQVQLHALP